METARIKVAQEGERTIFGFGIFEFGSKMHFA
jgi:hypothetical protein